MGCAWSQASFDSRQGLQAANRIGIGVESLLVSEKFNVNQTSFTTPYDFGSYVELIFRVVDDPILGQAFYRSALATSARQAFSRDRMIRICHDQAFTNITVIRTRANRYQLRCNISLSLAD